MPLPISSTPASSSPSLQEAPAIVSSSFSKNPSEDKKKKSFALPQFPKFNKLQKKLAISIVGLILVLVGGLATYLVSRQSQDIRQRAYEGEACSETTPCSTGFTCGTDNTCHADSTPTPSPQAAACASKRCTPVPRDQCRSNGLTCQPWESCFVTDISGQILCVPNVGSCNGDDDCSDLSSSAGTHACNLSSHTCGVISRPHCTRDAQCPAIRPVCDPDGNCITFPQCTDNSTCGAGGSCVMDPDLHVNVCKTNPSPPPGFCLLDSDCHVVGQICNRPNKTCVNPADPTQCDPAINDKCVAASPPASGAAAPGSPAPVPPAPNLCPNDPAQAGVIWRKFVCNSCIRTTAQGPNGDWGTGWRCESGTPTESNSPLTLGPNECGQVDVYTSSSYNSFCGYATGSQTYSCGEARCQGGTATPPGNPPPTPPIIPGAACIGMNLGSDTDGISNYGGQAPFLSTDPLTKTITLTLKVRNTTAATAQILINDGNCGQPITFNKVGTVGDTSTYRGTIAFSQFNTCPQSYGSPGAYYIQFTGTAGSPVDTTKCVASARITNPPPGEPPTEPVCTGLNLMQTANGTRNVIPANHAFTSTEYIHLQCDLPAGTTSVDYRVIPPGQTPVTIPTFRSVSIITALMMSETFQVGDYPTNSEYQCRPCVGSLCSAWTTLPAACKKSVAWTAPLACTSVVSNPVAPTLSSTATFTCNGTSATRYEFEYKAPGSTTYTSLAASTTVSRSVATSALVAGAYQYRCRACSGLATCTQNDVTACQGTFTVPVASCNQTCTSDADCSNGTKCFDVGGTTGKVCRNTTNTTCSATTDCTCPTPAPTPAVTSTPAPQPDAGFIAVKYNDLNGNGSKQDTEPGLSWNFEWDRNGNNIWTAYETYGDRNGQGGRLGGLADGDTIRVREKSKDGWRATTTTQHSIVVHKNETAVVYFGNQQTSSKVLATCNGSCSSNGDCVSGYTCSNGMCRNASCTSSSSCVCTSTPKTTTITPKATPKPAATALPVAGDGLKSAGAIGFGAVITVLGLIGLLAL